jgi:hypothetical protein
MIVSYGDCEALRRCCAGLGGKSLRPVRANNLMAGRVTGMRGSFCVVGVDETVADGENKVTTGQQGRVARGEGRSKCDC